MTRRIKPFAMSSILLLTITFGLAAPASAESSELVGSWLITLVDDATGAVAPGAYTFGSDGTLVASTSIEGVSSGHGAWKKSGGDDGDSDSDSDSDTFSGTFIAFTEDGNPLTVIEARSSFETEVDGDSLTMVLDFEIRLNGTLIAAGSSQGTGARIEP